MDRRIEAIFFDIDGTLRDFETGKIPDSARAALALARREGIKLFVATGRHHLELDEENLLEGIRFDGYVTLNGQYCYGEKDLIYSHSFEKAVVREMVEILGEFPFPCLFMEEDRMYINMVDDLVRKAQAGIGTKVPPLGSASQALNEPIYQMVPYISEKKKRLIQGRLSGCQWVSWHDGRGYDVMPEGGSKWTGICKMAEHFGIPLSRTAAIGDGRNDVVMIRQAAVGIAMGNGKDEAKAAADYVTASVREDGLWKAIRYLIDLYV